VRPGHWSVLSRSGLPGELRAGRQLGPEPMIRCTWLTVEPDFEPGCYVEVQCSKPATEFFRNSDACWAWCQEHMGCWAHRVEFASLRITEQEYLIAKVHSE
jgi:hypothetical protein